MIRRMILDDIPCVTNYMRLPNQRELFNITQKEADNTSSVYMHRVLTQCYESGTCWVSVCGNEITGFAVGIEIPFVWSPAKVDLVLLAVQGDNRITTAKLFKKWLSDAENHPRARRIMVDQLDETNFNYEKIGFEKLRTTYSKEI